MKKSAIKERVKWVSEITEITDFLDRFPRQLSGGQQQRVALARALAIKPRVLLLDEPLSGLDANLRERMQYELRVMQRTAQITSIYVTHDQNEAFALADRVIVMNDGVIAQIGTPTEIYSTPQSRFVAQFIGISSSFECVVGENDPVTGKATLNFQQSLLHTLYRPEISNAEKVTVIIRTNRIGISKEPDSACENNIPCTIISNTLNGTFWRVGVKAGEYTLRADISNNTNGNVFHGWVPGDTAYLVIKPEDIWFYNK